MTISQDIINSKINQIKKVVGFDTISEIQSNAVQSELDDKNLKTTEAEVAISGLKSLADGVESPVTVTDKINVSRAITTLSQSSDIQAITGSSKTGGLLSAVYTSNSLEAIKADLETSLNATVAEANSVANQVFDGTGIPQAIEDFSSQLSTIQQDISASVEQLTSNPLLNYALSVDNTILSTITNVVDAPLTTQYLILDLVAEGQTSAVSTLLFSLGLEGSEITNLINDLENDLNQLFQLPDIGINTTNVLPIQRLNSAANQWNGSTTSNDVFSVVHTTEELQFEFANANREITEVVVHWTESFKDQHLTASDIHSYSPNGIPYHYIIRRDGILERGRPLSVTSDHIANHSDYSIAIAFVGGINANSGTPDFEAFLSSDSLTIAQHKTFQQFLKSGFAIWSGLQVWGHSEIDETVQDPGFPVESYIETKFNRTNLTSPEKSYSRAELVSIALN